ncbi:MAG: CYTH domain-containing protein [bacterium]
MEEIEAKFLGIDTETIEKRLQELGAIFEKERLMYAISFDFPGFPLDANSAWVRLRNEGDVIKIAFKQRLGVKADGGNDDGMREIETEAGHFEDMRQILLAIGMVEKFVMEKKRRSWVKDGIRYDIDFWPRLDPYLEIETDSWDRLEEAARELGLKPEEKKIFSASQIYKMAGINDTDYVQMTFAEWVPRDPSAS